MKGRIRFSLILLFCIDVLGVGCVDPGEHDLDSQHRAIMNAQDEVVFSRRWEHAHTAASVRDRPGPRERALPVGDCVALFGQEHLREEQSFKSRVTLGLARYLDHGHRQLNDVADLAQDLDQCEVWLYRWTESASRRPPI